VLKVLCLNAVIIGHSFYLVLDDNVNFNVLLLSER
jgi:hypothetical protein